MTPCAIDGCPKPTHVRGWCTTHYARWKRLGDANAEVTRWTRQARTCTVDGCDRKPNARGLCKTHYNRWLHTGSTDMAPEHITKPCKLDGCDRPGKGRGWCSMHYERWRQHGDPLFVKTATTKTEPRAKPLPPGPCNIDGCGKKRKARGWCRLHYERWTRTGDPLGTKQRPKPEPKPETPPVDVPDHLAAYLERRRKRQEGARGVNRTITQQSGPSGMGGRQMRQGRPESDMRGRKTA